MSIDVPHHFALIDELMKNGTANAPRLAGVSGYPLMSHWIATGVGYLIGSGLVAMWFICIVSLYICYYLLARIFSFSGGIPGTALFVVFVILSLSTRAIIGFEVVGNFFYAQLVAMVIYALALLMLVQIGRQSVLLRTFFVLCLFAFALEIHPVPALHLAGAFGLLLMLELLVGTVRAGHFDWKAAGAIVLFGTCGLLVLMFSRSFRSMVYMSQNDGSLLFGQGILLFVALAILLVPVSAWMLWRRIRANDEPESAELVLFAALSASAFLVSAQFIALRLFGYGSSYAIKKHFFILVTVALLGLARLIAGWFPAWKLPIPPRLVATFAAATITVIVLYRPGVPLYPMLQALEYAEHAVHSGHPKFEPGNTFVLAASLDPVTRYLISTTAFRADIATEKSVGLITGTFVPQRDAAFIMLDRTPDVISKCSERYAETWKFVIVPSVCLANQ